VSYNLDNRVSEALIKLNTCYGCVKRGKCKDEQFVNQGDYCRRKELTKNKRTKSHGKKHC
jgi:rRNA processing protein Gar1